MIRLCALMFLVGCAVSPDAPTSSASFTGEPTFFHARTDHGVVNYGGALLTRWTISWSPTEGCMSTPGATLEVNTLSSMPALPVGSAPLRPAQMTVDTLPSGFLAYAGATLTSGTVMITSASDTFVSGSLDAELMVAGAPKTVHAQFSSPVCAAM